MAGVTNTKTRSDLSSPGLLLPSRSALSSVSSPLLASLHSLSLLSGLALILLGLVCFVVSPQLEVALVSLVQSWTALVSGRPSLSSQSAEQISTSKLMELTKFPDNCPVTINLLKEARKSDVLKIYK